MSEWLPLSEAPKDRDAEILGLVADDYCILRWDGLRWTADYGWTVYDQYIEQYRWQPLPPK